MKVELEIFHNPVIDFSTLSLSIQLKKKPSEREREMFSLEFGLSGTRRLQLNIITIKQNDSHQLK